MHGLRPLAAVLLALPLLQASAAQPVTRASVTAHGVRLTLAVPAHAFPRDALERFTLRVKNVSRRPVLTLLEEVDCGPSPSVEVADAGGAPTPQFPQNAMPHSCPIVPGSPLKPGQSWTGKVLAIVNGVSIRGTLLIGRFQKTEIDTPAVAIRVTGTGSRPVRVRHSAGGPYVVVPRPEGGQGPLYMEGSTLCGAPPGPETLDSTMIWIPVTGDRLESGCQGPQQWYAYAGYVGYPIVTISYAGQ